MKIVVATTKTEVDTTSVKVVDDVVEGYEIDVILFLV
jgi:hypothetical protein